MVVLVAVLEQELVGGVGGLPPGCDVADRLPTGEVFYQPDALLENVPLLLRCHGDRVLVRIAVAPDLVPGVYDRLHLLREGLYRVAGDEPGSLHIVLLEELQEARRADLAREQAP